MTSDEQAEYAAANDILTPDEDLRDGLNAGAVLGACLMGALFLGVMAGLWRLGMFAT